MKDNFLNIIKILIIFFSCHCILIAEELNITASKVSFDKKKSKVILDGEIKASDASNNSLYANKAEYNKKLNLLNSFGTTKIVTNQNYVFESENVEFDNSNKIIKSDFNTKIIDPDGNIIEVNMFNYNSIENILYSRGEIILKDKNKNEFLFSEIYIDEKKKKIIGSDAKIFFKDNSFKANPDNDPRIFANSVSISEGVTSVQKGVLTYCKFRENEKCPPWELRARKIKHNNSKKTVYYDNAFLKIYDFPIFYFPKLSHPDPTVKRRSGFLVPSFSNSSNIGFGVNVPYFWDIAKDKDITFTPRILPRNETLYLAEYRQNFLNSSFFLDAGYTKGYKKKTVTKSPGSRSHIFAKLLKSLANDQDYVSDLEINLQKVSNNTYPRVYELETTLVDYFDDTLSNTISYNFQKDDLFFNTRLSAYEDLRKTGNEKYEFIYPEASLEKNILIDENLGIIDFKSELNVRNFNVDNKISTLSNEFSWSSNSWVSKYGFENELLGLIKNVNYDAENVTTHKTSRKISEFYGALGFKSELGFFKYSKDNTLNTIKPKLLLKLSPNDSRDISDLSTELSFSNLFKLNKINNIDEVDTGTSLSLGFDYKVKNLDNNKKIKGEKFSFSLGQIISAKENPDLPSKSTLNEKLSDVLGNISLNLNENTKFSSNFKIDQNLEEFNQSQYGLDIIYPKMNFNINYLEERKHLGNQKYVETKAGLNFDKTKLSLSGKRNLLSNSSEFYDLTYEYLNDCLKAGIAFRREFYRDRDLEPEDTLMFKITFSPLGDISSPTFNQ